MRWVFISLVLINVFYFLVQLIVDRDEYVRLSPVIAKDAPKLKLLGEVPAPIARGVEYTPAIEALCPLVGPFSDEQDGQSFVTHLRKAGYAAVLKTVAVPEPLLTWVYIDPYPTWEDSLQILKQLQSEKVDSFIVTEEGPLKNAISLGYFENTGSARGLQAKLVAIGYAVKTEEIERTHDELWVTISGTAAAADGDESIKAYLENRDDLTLQEQACLSG